MPAISGCNLCIALFGKGAADKRDDEQDSVLAQECRLCPEQLSGHTHSLCGLPRPVSFCQPHVRIGTVATFALRAQV